MDEDKKLPVTKIIINLLKIHYNKLCSFRDENQRPNICHSSSENTVRTEYLAIATVRHSKPFLIFNYRETSNHLDTIIGLK